MARQLTTVDSTLDAVPGVVSVCCGRLSQPPSYERACDVMHPAASTLKVAVLAALFREVDAGRLDLDQTVSVVNEFASAIEAPTYGCDRGHDSDEQVWLRLGEEVPLGWLA